MSVGINFQPSGAAVPSGYLADSGGAYASRGNGYTYGWSGNNTSAYDRNMVSDQRYDTTIHTQLYGTFGWEMAVPNGTYRVHAVAGDARYNDSIYRFNVEGQTLVNGTPTSSNRFVEGTTIVKVTDGRLTINNATGSQNNKLCFVDIASLDVPAVAGVTYVSDLTPVSATNGWGPYEKDMSNGGQAANDGRILNLGGTTYEKGLGVNANSSVVYNLAGRYDTFKADIGIDNEATSKGSVVFQVLADGVKIYDSGLMTKATAKKSLSLAVAGVAQLTLMVTDGGNGKDWDHADWANAHLVPTTATVSVPAAPSNLATTSLSSTQVTLTWTDTSSNETGFKIERSTDGTTFTQIATVAANVTSYSDSGLSAGTKYYYRLSAYNSAGSSSVTPVATATTATTVAELAQGKPTTASSLEDATFSASGATDGNSSTRWSSAGTDPQWLQVDLGGTYNVNEVKLNWEVASAKSFQIQVSNDGSNWTSIYSTTTSTGGAQDLTGLSGIGRYVRMYGTQRNTQWGYSLWDFNVYGTPAVPPVVTVPTAPSNLSATAASASQVNLSWTDNSSNETGFKIERSTDGTNFSSLATVGAGVATYTDSTAAAATRYTYRVTAYNSAGSSAASNVATVTTPSATPTVTPRYVVSTTGSDSASGTATSPFRTVAKAMSVAQAGDIILVKNGAYHESLSLTRSGAAGKPITLMGESTSGVVFDGSGLSRVIAANGAQYITIQNITVRYCSNGPQGGDAAVVTGTYWTLKDMVVEKVDGTGVDVQGSHVTLLRVTAQYNGVAGIDGSWCTDVLVKDCITRYNNNGMANPVWKNQTSISGWNAATLINGLYYMDPNFEAGGGKWWKTSGVTIDGMVGYGNVGPAIWFDMDSTNVVIRNCNLHDNRGLTSNTAYQGAGIELEMQSAGPLLVEGNTLSNNQGAGVWLCNATNSTVRNNTFVNDNILLKDDNRDAYHPLNYDTITGNRFKNGYIETGIGQFSTTSGTGRHLTINGNTYDNGGGTLMKWAGVSYNSLSTIRSVLGFETTGTLGTVTP